MDIKLTSPISNASPPYCSPLQIMSKPFNPMKFHRHPLHHSSSYSWCAHPPPRWETQAHPDPAMQTRAPAGCFLLWPQSRSGWHSSDPHSSVIRCLSQISDLDFSRLLPTESPTTEALMFLFLLLCLSHPPSPKIYITLSGSQTESLPLQVGILWNSSLSQTDHLIQAARTGSNMTLFSVQHMTHSFKEPSSKRG